MSPHERGRIGIIEDDLVVGGTLHIGWSSKAIRRYGGVRDERRSKGYAAQRPDLVVCDILLPDMSGEDVFLQACPSLAASRSCLSPASARSRTRFA